MLCMLQTVLTQGTGQQTGLQHKRVRLQLPTMCQYVSGMIRRRGGAGPAQERYGEYFRRLLQDKDLPKHPKMRKHLHQVVCGGLQVRELSIMA